MRMLILSPSFLPEELVTEFNTQWEEKKDDIIKEIDYREKFKELMVKLSNTKQATQIYGQAITVDIPTNIITYSNGKIRTTESY
jgi:hypothetical protein